MVAKKEIQNMQRAYGYMYEVENLIRNFIHQMMSEAYGTDWFHIAPRKVLRRPPAKAFDLLNFNEYERIYFQTYPVFEYLPYKFFESLHALYAIRNKIAHHHPLSSTEFSMLEEAHKILKTYLDQGKTLSLVATN